MTVVEHIYDFYVKFCPVLTEINTSISGTCNNFARVHKRLYNSVFAEDIYIIFIK